MPLALNFAALHVCCSIQSCTYQTYIWYICDIQLSILQYGQPCPAIYLVYRKDRQQHTIPQACDQFVCSICYVHRSCRPL